MGLGKRHALIEVESLEMLRAEVRDTRAALEALAAQINRLSPDGPRWMRPKEMAKHLKCSRKSLPAWARQGRLLKQGQGRGVMYAEKI